MKQTDPLASDDLRRLLDVTAERARAAQEAALNLSVILDKIEYHGGTIAELVAIIRNVEGAVQAIISYLATRDDSELKRLRAVLEQSSDVSVHVEQRLGGIQTGDEGTISSEKDINVGD